MDSSHDTKLKKSKKNIVIWVNFQHQIHRCFLLRGISRLPIPHLRDNAKTRWKCLALPDAARQKKFGGWKKHGGWKNSKVYGNEIMDDNGSILSTFQLTWSLEEFTSYIIIHFQTFFPVALHLANILLSASHSVSPPRKILWFFLSLVVHYESQNLKNAWKTKKSIYDRVLSNYEFSLVGF